MLLIFILQSPLRKNGGGRKTAPVSIYRLTSDFSAFTEYHHNARNCEHHAKDAASSKHVRHTSAFFSADFFKYRIHGNISGDSRIFNIEIPTFEGISFFAWSRFRIFHIFSVLYRDRCKNGLSVLESNRICVFRPKRVKGQIFRHNDRFIRLVNYRASRRNSPTGQSVSFTGETASIQFDFLIVCSFNGIDVSRSSSGNKGDRAFCSRLRARDHCRFRYIRQLRRSLRLQRKQEVQNKEYPDRNCRH